jgi:hypothetical protein
MALLEPAFFVGLGVVAVWLHLRFPNRRPRSLARAFVHVAAAFVLFSLVPCGVDLVTGALSAPVALLVVVLGMLIPAFGYVLLSWVWLIVRIHELGRPPRGGHRVPASASTS